MNSGSRTYPVDEVIPDILHALQSSNTVILSAPPGAGKTTRVPIALLRDSILNNGKILMLEPRRLAARRAAEFMSSQLGEKTGETIGYRIRGEAQCGAKTRVEILTEGILTRLLQHTPELPGVNVLVFDEFHERSIHADLGLAFSLDVQKHLRNDLRILIMSATLDGNHLASILGHVPFVESKGKLFPVETRYSKFASDKPVEIRTAEVVRRALQNDDGDVLVFLPGWREIQRTERALTERQLPPEAILHVLHGEASSASQAAALAAAPVGKRKVILSTNVAETSLTIEGVRVVVDSGLVRVSRFDPRRGMSGLVTVSVSKASADQRRGRAGRLAPGVCYRLWTETEHERLAETAQPEIKSADLAPLALDLAQWGSPNGENLLFIDPPPSANLQQAQAILRDLDACDQKGQLTTVGRAMADLPVHPRLAHMILRAKDSGLGGMACELAALLEERDLFAGQKDADVDLTSRWMELRRARGNTHDRIVAQARRLRAIIKIDENSAESSKVGLLLAFAYPDRIAKRREKNGNAYLLASGTTAVLPPGSVLARNEFLAIAEADTVGTSVRIFLCAPVTKEDVVDSLEANLVAEKIVRWDSATESVQARHVERLGAIKLSEKPISNEDDRILSAMIEGIHAMGLDVLPWNRETQSLRDRSEWLRTSGLVVRDWPDLSERQLIETVERWLGPFLSGIRQRSQLSTLDLEKILRSLFTHRQFQELETLAPARLKVPSGSSIAIDYSSDKQPILAVRLQELFGQTETPRLGKGKVPVVIHLLSPAKRPLAVTQDLRSFWENVYPDIRKQLRARYPKHVWPEDPMRAAPTNRTRRHLKGAP
jgi:ATP-dependent helicase HrpB